MAETQGHYNDLTPGGTEYLLSIRFPEADLARMNELSEKAQQGVLAHGEQEELDSYINVGNLLALMQSKARRRLALRAASPSNAPRTDHGEAETWVLLRALEVFGDGERAMRWMTERNPALWDRAPLEALGSDEGRRELVNVLGRIQHGVIS